MPITLESIAPTNSASVATGLATIAPVGSRRSRSAAWLWVQLLAPVVVVMLMISACGSSTPPESNSAPAPDEPVAASSDPELDDVAGREGGDEEKPSADRAIDSGVPSTIDNATKDSDDSKDSDSDSLAPADLAPAGEALRWVVTLLDGPAPDVDVIEERFSASFLAEVPASQIIGLLPQLKLNATGAWTVTTSEIDPSGLMATAELAAEGSTSLSVRLRVDSQAPYRIEGLLFQPIADVDQVESLEALDVAMAEFAPSHRLGLFQVVAGECITLHDAGAEEVMPVGSIFKLWILAELGRQVSNGEAAWDEMFPVQDRYKASPDGEVFMMEAGTEVTLQRYAELMISISDNSATDHLLYRLGRENVEAAMVTSGVAQPERNQPFLSAGELFMLKFSPVAPNSDDYRALDTNAKREVLAELANATVPWVDAADSFPLANADGIPVAQPRDHDLEWFATPADLCRTHAHLAELAAQPGLEPVAAVMSIDPTAGLPFDRTDWSDLRFKGGSEPGLTAVAWWMQDHDGRAFVVAGGLENRDEPVITFDALSLLQQGTNFVAALGDEGI